MTDLDPGLPEAARELRTAFEKEVEPLRPALWRYCYRLTGSAWDAEDLVQETLQRALSRLAGLWQPTHVRGYLFRIASNAWIDRHRREARAEMVELAETLPAPADDPEVRAGAHQAMARLVATLTPLQRVVFLLCETLDFTSREAASSIGTSEGAVKAALHRARLRLAAAREPEENVPARLKTPTEVDRVVARYVAAFDARDPDAIASLLHEDAVVTIVGCAEERGRETICGGSLAEWARDEAPQRAVPGTLEGRDAIFVLTDTSGGPALYTVIELERGQEIQGLRDHYFCPEFLEHVAASLGLPVVTHGHQYPFAA